MDGRGYAVMNYPIHGFVEPVFLLSVAPFAMEVVPPMERRTGMEY
jgi:hypothetical protein